MPGSLSPTAQRVQDILRALGAACEVTESPVTTRTAADAARLVGCTVGQIAKSLVFRRARTGGAVLVITSGANRVAEARVAEVIGEPIGKADADFVREHTGYAIGGVPPVGHARPLEVLVDEDLLRYDEVWAAGGTPNALFRTTPAELARMAGGRTVRVT